MTDQQPAVAPAFMGDIVARIDRRIADLLNTDLARWAAVDADLETPLRSLLDLVMAGGKRLRPAFCYWAFVGRGGDPDDPRIIDAGAALELVHVAALIHDDVVDRSDRRHGVATVHIDAGHRHALRSWRGDSGRFGEGIAILVGDMASVYADILIGPAPRAAIEVFDELRLEVNAGQLLDLLGSARLREDTGAAETAKLICQFKSAKYTVERPLHLGAALADHDRLAAVAGPLTDYGLPLGEAFQLKDDLLGAFGDPAKTGKPVGEDLREGKPTLLYALARARARARAGASAGAGAVGGGAGGGAGAAVGAGAARLLADRFGAPDLTGDEVVALQRIFEATGARAEVEAKIGRLVDQSLAAAALLPLTDEARQALVELAHFVAWRDY